MFSYFFKLKNFDKNFKIFLPISLFLFFVFLLISIKLIIDSPHDYQQGNAVKIMYIHVPSAWMSLLIYSIIALLNISAFIWKNPFFYIISRALALVGCVFAFLTLITGSLWGKPIWGAWWVWDARLTSMLLLFFLYLGYLILMESFDDKNKGEKISAIVSIVGFINVPIIKFSVEYWNSLHQKSSILRSGGIAIHQSMLQPLISMFFVYLFYTIFICLIKIKNELINKKLSKKHYTKSHL